MFWLAARGGTAQLGQGKSVPSKTAVFFDVVIEEAWWPVPPTCKILPRGPKIGPNIRSNNRCLICFCSWNPGHPTSDSRSSHRDISAHKLSVPGVRLLLVSQPDFLSYSSTRNDFHIVLTQNMFAFVSNHKFVFGFFSQNKILFDGFLTPKIQLFAGSARAHSADGCRKGDPNKKVRFR